MKLSYNEEGKFRIIQFTDLHLGEYPYKENDKKTLAGIKKLVEEYEVDLIVVTGDIIYSLPEHGAKNPKESFIAFIEFLNTLEVPSAITFGNHDSEAGVSREDLNCLLKEHLKFPVEQKEVFIIDNRKNYIIEILSDDEPEQIVYIVDSGEYSDTPYSYYAWILTEQIQWFKNVSEKYKKNDQIKKNLIFQHIPLPEYWLAALDIRSGKFNENIAMNLGWTNGQEEEIPLNIKHGVFSPEVNSGFFLQMLLSEETWGIFVGHDHDNSFDGVYKDIHLVYGQCSGYNTYGSDGRGGRIIDLNRNDKAIKTYSVYY